MEHKFLTIDKSLHGTQRAGNGHIYTESKYTCTCLQQFDKMYLLTAHIRFESLTLQEKIEERIDDLKIATRKIEQHREFCKTYKKKIKKKNNKKRFFCQECGKLEYWEMRLNKQIKWLQEEEKENENK